MPSISQASRNRLNAAYPTLKKLFLACADDPKCPPFMVLDAQRGKAAQEKAFALGHSRAHFGQSAHNWSPALALDVVPQPLNWSDLKSFERLADFVLARAKALGIAVTWGGSWPKLRDMPHYEVANWKALAASHAVKPYGG